MNDEFLPDPQYKFISGHGDSDHETRLSDAVAKGYRVKWITHNPDGAADHQELVVLMEMNQEPKPRTRS